MDAPERHQRFEEIYQAHYPAVLGYVQRRTCSADDAVDAISETFMTAWRRLDDIPAGPGTRLWLFGVARRVLANHRRGASRQAALALRLRAELTAWAQTAPAEDLGGPGGNLAEVRAAFQRLSDADRELLSLVAWEKLSAAEIAAVLGCSTTAVGPRLHRARKRLARALSSAGLDLSSYGARAVALAEEKS